MIPICPTRSGRIAVGESGMTDAEQGSGGEYFDLLLDLEHRWHRTQNPLCVWEAIAVAQDARPPRPVPEWCMPYLAAAARGMTALTWKYLRQRRDDPRADAGKMWNELATAIHQTLGLAAPRTKNAFARLHDDAVLQRVERDQQMFPAGTFVVTAKPGARVGEWTVSGSTRPTAEVLLGEKLNIESESAKRKLGKGKMGAVKVKSA